MSDKADKHSSQIQTAAVLLPPYVEHIPADIAERLRDRAAAVKKVDAAWLDDRLRRVPPDRAGWVDIERETAVDTFLETIADRETFNTLQFLGLFHQRLISRPEAEMPEAARRGARLLLGKFEVHGRIFTRYTGGFTKASETYDALLAYGLLSLSLLAIYRRLNKLDYLNAGLKVNDMLGMAASYMGAPVETFVALASLCYGKSQLERFYDSRGFRLPSDQ